MIPIKYETMANDHTAVFVGNRKAGVIRTVEGGYRYHARNSNLLYGNVFPTLEAVKADLERVAPELEWIENRCMGCRGDLSGC